MVIFINWNLILFNLIEFQSNIARRSCIKTLLNILLRIFDSSLRRLYKYHPAFWIERCKNLIHYVCIVLFSVYSMSTRTAWLKCLFHNPRIYPKHLYCQKADQAVHSQPERIDWFYSYTVWSPLSKKFEISSTF